MKNKLTQNILIAICIILTLWVAIGSVDFFRVKSFEQPVFTVEIETADDGGTGLYYGLGYSFELKGNFMPEDELPGVTHYKYYIFNKLIAEGIRD